VLQKDALLKAGLYVSPVGDLGVSMVDVRDIADAAVREILRRDDAGTALPRVSYELSGPDALTGASLAALWSDVLGRDVRYGGNDLDAFEANMKSRAPGWIAYDMRAMMGRYLRDGAVAAPEDLDRLTTLLGRPPRSYRDFATETAQSWRA
jgi:uncharacterized protein YbjT (DUF2867 family)